MKRILKQQLITLAFFAGIAFSVSTKAIAKAPILGHFTTKGIVLLYQQLEHDGYADKFSKTFKETHQRLQAGEKLATETIENMLEELETVYSSVSKK